MAEKLQDSYLAAHDQLFRTLRMRIMYGEMGPGQAITLRGVASEFGVSVTPVREALKRLAAEGALSISVTGRFQTPELSNDRIEELARPATCAHGTGRTFADN
jgi:DNA-binding GntR family transcriptional regulator